MSKGGGCPNASYRERGRRRYYRTNGCGCLIMVCVIPIMLLIGGCAMWTNYVHEQAQAELRHEIACELDYTNSGSEEYRPEDCD